MVPSRAVRRFVYWYLPLIVSLAATAVFAYGFVSFLRGDTGTPVDIAPAPIATPAAAPATIAPLVLGDSLARGAGDETGLGISGRLDQELKRRGLKARRTYNLGVNGARTADLLRQIESANVQQLLREANVIVISIGGNDLWGGSDWRTAPPPDPEKAMRDVLDRIDTVVKRVRAANPKARIFFVGLYSPMGKVLAPYVARWNARMLERFGGDGDFTVVQTADLFMHRDRLALDRFHPNGEGYELITRRIADAL
jgi:lysophospholipase L1-like esterase